MPNLVNYAETVGSVIEEKYEHSLLTADLGINDEELKWDGADVIKVPTMSVEGFGEHSRDGGWNRSAASNDWIPYRARHDRDVEIFVDKQDVTDTNGVLATAKIANKFVVSQSVPEKDSYRMSTIASDWEALGNAPVTTALTKDNILTIIDSMIDSFNEAGVDLENRFLYITTAAKRLLTTAINEAKMRDITNGATDVMRVVKSLDDIQIKNMPAARMKDGYDYTKGAVPAVGAKQINFILIQKRAVSPVLKTESIYFFEPGTHTSGDGYLYQHRELSDIFVRQERANGIAVHKDA